MVITVLALLICIVGGIVYCLPINPKVNELGRIMFFCGLLVFLMANGGKVVHFG